jgi:hypothetical protein
MDEDDDLNPEMYGGPKPISKHDSNVMEADDDEKEFTVNDLGDEGGVEGALGDGGPEEGPEPPVEQPEAGEEVADMPDAEPDAGMDTGMMDAPAEPNPQEEREDIQNQLLKLQVSALEKMNSKMDLMDTTIAQMRQMMNNLSNDVEEVREPTNVEKVAARKEDSHPYYYRLNDLWQGNAFQARMDEKGVDGMKQLEDGTFIADFDNFPELNQMELKKSFNQ